MGGLVMFNISINRNSPVPYYYQLEEGLRALIREKVLEPGDMLPSEMTIATQLGVSRITVRQALQNLTGEGLLVRRRGIGTSVAYPRIVVPITADRLIGLTESMAQYGVKVRSEVLEQILVQASGEVMRELQMTHTDMVIMIRRLRFVNDIPLVVENVHHPYVKFPKLLKMDLKDRSIYEILQQVYQTYPGEAQDSFVAQAANKELAALLDIDVGAPVMRYKRTAFDQTREPMEFTFSFYRADQYQFVTNYRQIEAKQQKGGA
jgi:GntR family transcriptional regulator